MIVIVSFNAECFCCEACNLRHWDLLGCTVWVDLGFPAVVSLAAVTDVMAGSGYPSHFFPSIFGVRC